jgi:alkylation response protein AidB-like acyl-CoA dehydrogenase
MAPILEAVGAGTLVMCVLGTEAGAMSNYCETSLTPVDGGYRLNGRKIFSTLSPVADVLLVLARHPGDQGERIAIVPVLSDSPGVDPRDDWDALGMRASGSQSIVFSDVFVPGGSEIDFGPWGGPSATGLLGQVAGGSGLTGAFLGIAEAAHALAVDLVKTRRKVPSTGPLAERAPIQRVIADNEVDLASARAMLERSTRFVDAVLAEHPGNPLLETAHELMAETQKAKLHVQLRAVEIVDRALTASGGAGYMSASPLSRLYRDVRAGPFMQQYSPIEAYEYLGKHALGLDPKLDL